MTDWESFLSTRSSAKNIVQTLFLEHLYHECPDRAHALDLMKGLRMKTLGNLNMYRVFFHINFEQ